jgi:hypothetical protein
MTQNFRKEGHLQVRLEAVREKGSQRVQLHHARQAVHRQHVAAAELHLRPGDLALLRQMEVFV